jgi:hypothetical protein
MNLSGSCICGNITFEIVPPFDTFTHCYCQRCRKASGAGRTSVLVTAPDQLVWTRGAETLRRWDLEQASSFATSFCPQCGSPLPRLTRSGDHALIPAGALDSPLPLLPQAHEHWASRANWICLDETGVPVFDHDLP